MREQCNDNYDNAGTYFDDNLVQYCYEETTITMKLQAKKKPTEQMFA
jgi:hypothetical protein